MLVFKNLTGKKESKGAYEEVVILGPTPGEIKFTPFIQEKLGVKSGDSGLVVEGEDANGKLVIYIAKGKTAQVKRDENGQAVKGERGRDIILVPGFGGVLREAAAGSSNLRLTAAIGWKAAGGSEKHNRFFTLGEGVDAAVPTGETNEDGTDELFETTFYPLVWKKDVAKMIRNEEGTEEDDEDEDDAPQASDIAVATDVEPSTEAETTNEVDFDEEEV
jgi:hypothetical protein